MVLAPLRIQDVGRSAKHLQCPVSFIGDFKPPALRLQKQQFGRSLRGQNQLEHSNMVNGMHFVTPTSPIVGSITDTLHHNPAFAARCGLEVGTEWLALERRSGGWSVLQFS